MGRIGAQPHARPAGDVVSLTAEDVLGSRLAALREFVRSGFDDAPAQVQGFILRVLDARQGNPEDPPLYKEKTIEACLDAVRFDGYPALARAGYSLARIDPLATGIDVAERFVDSIGQQRCRPQAVQAELARDALALLGIADGLRVVSKGTSDLPELQTARAWTRDLLEQHGGSDSRLSRARALASDLLDDGGRFGRHLARSDDGAVAALDLCLWRSWPNTLRNVLHPDASRRRMLFKNLLTARAPGPGELVQAAAWLCALDVLVDEIAAATVTDANSVARILARTQGGFRRWRWEAAPTRKNTMPARWLIDKESDVQAFLFAMLYPYLGDQLEDEQYLQGFGLRQGRFDFAVSGLGLIVEVKLIRKSGDVSTIEAEIADDLALYFKAGNPFETMIVYIYDDRDRPEPEKYAAIRDALKRRSERIVDVIIVPRPSMIPDRNFRTD